MVIMAKFNKDRDDYKEENSQDKNQSDKDKAQEYADDLGKIEPPNKFIQKEIARLRRKNIIQ